MLLFFQTKLLYIWYRFGQSHGYFDLPFVGNFGKDGELGVIENIKNLKSGTQILIFTNEEDMFWQESKTIRKYIIDNLNKIGELENYTIYEI